MPGRNKKHPKQPQKAIRLPEMFDYQQDILDSPAHYKVVDCGRQLGKSISCLRAAILGHGPVKDGKPLHKGAYDGAQIIWLMPTYDALQVVWRNLHKALDGVGSFSGVGHRVELPSGGSISLKSGAAALSIRGGTYDGAIIDEAAHMDEEVWSMVVAPTLATRKNAWAIFVSTPDGDNYFYRLFKQAENSPGWQRWQYPSRISPLITDDFLTEQRRINPDIVYRQEYEAEFITDTGGLWKRTDFRYYDHDGDVYTLQGQNGEQNKTVNLADCTLYATVDLAYGQNQTNDFTVITTSAVTNDGDILVLDVLRNRFSGADHLSLLQKVNAYWRERNHPLTSIYIETVQAQRALYDMAIRANLPARPYNPAGRDKISRAMPMLAKYENHKVYHPRQAEWLPILEAELLSAPKSEHDDVMDTLSMLANILPTAPGNVPAVFWVG